MRSMTGFGRGIAESEERKITAEIKTVNHKLLDLSVKSPRALFFCEDTVRRVCKKYLNRGHVDVFVTYGDNRQDKNAVVIDLALAARYKQAAEEVAALGVTNDMNVSALMRCPDVISVEALDDDEAAIEKLVEEATVDACQKVVLSREREGAALQTELSFRLDNLEKIVEEIADRAPMVSQAYAAKLKQRIAEALGSVQVDESRLLTEIACYVDKTNIDEEITRLRTHLAHGKNLMNEENEVGKRLDFLVQEINREINTTGSKSNDVVLTQKVLEAKNELEKFREQVQNIE